MEGNIVACFALQIALQQNWFYIHGWSAKTDKNTFMSFQSQPWGMKKMSRENVPLEVADVSSQHFVHP